MLWEVPVLLRILLWGCGFLCGQRRACNMIMIMTALRRPSLRTGTGTRHLGRHSQPSVSSARHMFCEVGSCEPIRKATGLRWPGPRGDGVQVLNKVDRRGQALVVHFSVISRNPIGRRSLPVLMSISEIRSIMIQKGGSRTESGKVRKSAAAECSETRFSAPLQRSTEGGAETGN